MFSRENGTNQFIMTQGKKTVVKTIWKAIIKTPAKQGFVTTKNPCMFIQYIGVLKLPFTKGVSAALKRSKKD